MASKNENPEKVLADTQAQLEAEGVVAAQAKEQAERWAQLSEKAQALLLKNKGLVQCVGAMLASRQLYAMALHDMDFRVDQLEDADEEKVVLKEIFISSAAQQASNPFEETELFAGMQQTVMPWMEQVSKEHTDAELLVRQEEYNAAEKDRRSRGVVINFTYDQTVDDEGTVSDVSKLDRERSLVLVGWEPAVLWVLDKLLVSATEPQALLDEETPRQIMLLSRTSKLHQDPRILSVGGKGWEDCAKSNGSWPKQFLAEYLDKIKEPLDLFVVTDLPYAKTGYNFQLDSARASDAQKVLRRWATGMGSAMIGVVPLASESLPDLNTPDWEKLRMFTTLRGVSVTERDNGNYDIKVGLFASFDDVSKDELEEFKRSDIVTP
jgi:hypothetical protein